MHRRSEDRTSPPYEIIILAIFVIAALATLAGVMTGGGDHHAPGAATPFGPGDFPDIEWDEPLLAATAATPTPDGETFPVPPPPFSEDMFPCTECHDEDDEPDASRRELASPHDVIKLDHGPADRWCYDCHNPDDRDKLRLANGQLIGFEESHRLCGQCHGTIYRDWRSGIHGRRRGQWDGAKSYLLCAHCHNPHSPRFKPMKPLPPPVRPQFLDPNLRDRKAAADHDD